MLINHHNLHVEVDGLKNGPVVILLHHGLGSVKAWRRQVPALVEAGYRVVTYDRWGYGESDSRPSLDVPIFAPDLADLVSLTDQLQVQRASLIGHSDGGTIALYLASQQPERVSCLVTVAAHIYVEPKTESGILDLRRMFETNEHFRLGLESIHGEKFQTVFYNWFDGWYRSSNLDWDMRPKLRQISCPTLIVQGSEDEHATPQHAKDIAGSIQGAQLWLLSGANHMLPQEYPSEFNSAVLRFLKNQS